MKRQATISFPAKKPNVKRTKIVVSSKPVSLNTRILRALQSKLETKRYFADGTLSIVSASQQKTYLNPFAGIVVGSAPNQRTGDKIHVVGLHVFVTYSHQTAAPCHTHFEGNLVKANTVGSYTSTTINYYTGTDVHYTGFPTNGPDNKEQYSFYGKKKAVMDPPNQASASLVPERTMFEHRLKFNKPIQYVSGGVTVKDGDYLYLLNIDYPVTLAVTPSGALSVNYIVYYKDA